MAKLSCARFVQLNLRRFLEGTTVGLAEKSYAGNASGIKLLYNIKNSNPNKSAICASMVY